MYNIKQINTGVAELLAVKVPDGARGYTAIGSKVIFDLRLGLNSKRFDLPPGNWKPLGLSDELTEEQCREVVDEFKRESYNGIYYKDYSEVRPFLATSLQSFASLMQANGCYSVNPIPQPDVLLYAKDNDFYQRYWTDFNKWKEALAKTGTLLILKRLS